MQTTTNPAQPAEVQPMVLGQDDRLYFKGLFSEGLDIVDLDERDEHSAAVLELIGDLATSEALRAEAIEDREAAVFLANEFRVNRAELAAKNMETRGYAADSPDFKEQVRDETRTNIFYFNGLPSHLSKVKGWPETEATETEGLQELDSFLRQFLETSDTGGKHTSPQDADQARSILNNLTFIGEKELHEAALGLGMLWKMYLDSDPVRKLCILTAISDSSKYKGIQKSDAYLRDMILDTFSSEEIERYSGRIFNNIEDVISEDSSNVRVVFLDDWTISGKQLNRAQNEILQDPDNRKFLGSLEINLLVASDDRLKNGLPVQNDIPVRPVKVRAYYKAHTAEGANSANNSHVSGIHSTVNFDFGNPIEVMVKRFEQWGAPRSIPALASIVSPYKRENNSVGTT